MIRIKWYELVCDQCGAQLKCFRSEPTEEQAEAACEVVKDGKHYCSDKCYCDALLSIVLDEMKG